MPRILVADDNTNIQRMVTLALQERGVDVVAVGNGEAAVRKLPDVNPDLVLADVFMPVRNGYELCEYVKKDARFAQTPVILLVGAFDPLDEKEARRVGADGVLKKPFIPPDPLIAMVMSALEKNPKVAAELAKAKEVIAAPPPPPEALEIPMRVEPKPLPEYPEPTPEEAAAIYGFGKGVRALAAEDDEEEEPNHSKASKSLKISSADAQEDGDFDSASTKSDWRRNAADFEVPENVAFHENLDTFPSEKDVPPRHIQVTNQTEEPVATVPDALPESGHSWLSIKPEPEPETASQKAEETPSSIFGKISTVESAQESPRAAWLSDADSEEKADSFSITKDKAPQEAAPQSESKSKTATNATEWMDMMAPMSEYPEDGGWMANMSAPASKAEAPAPHTILEMVPAPSSQPITNTEETVEPEIAQIKAPEIESPTASNEHFFADEPYPHSRTSSYHFASDSDSQGAHQAAEESAPELVTSSASDFGHELLSASSQAKQEPKNISEQPLPEPLLLDEEHTDPIDVPSHQEEASVPEQPFFRPSMEELPAQIESASEHLESSVFQPAPIEPVLEEFSERIPTLPPPNREALMQIPFLMPPPPEPSAPVSSVQEPEPSAADVDAVVRKVLEKLQPQLQELFSQGMKPLVENLVHGELTKKGK